MNKIIDQRMEEARKTMKEYTTAAEALAVAICDQMQTEKGWKTRWHLGGWEAGIDNITIEADCCCFDEACTYEMMIRDALEDCNRQGPSITVRCTNTKFDCPIHSQAVKAE